MFPDVDPSDIVDLSPSRATRRTPSPAFAVARALAVVTGMDFDLNQGRLLREAKVLLSKGDAAVVCAALDEYYAAPASWWSTHDWRGKRGQAPTPQAIRETWGQWTPKATQPVSRYVEL